MQKAFVKKDPPWVDLPSIDTPIIAAELNRIEDGVDTIDSRVVSMDTTKADQVDLLVCFKAITFDDTTGTFTLTRWDGTTVTINTDIEKVVTNWDYDDDPTSAHYQSLVLVLSDGTTKYVDLSALITQFEFTDSATIAFTVSSSGDVTASVKNGSITAEKLQPNYLADVTAQANAASASATAAAGSVLDSEAWANGTRNGTEVGPSDPAYHNNAKWWKEKAQEIASGSIGGLSDVTIDNPQQGQDLEYNSTSQEWENSDGTKKRILNLVNKTTTFNSNGTISITGPDYTELITFNANGSITDAVTMNGKVTTKTTSFAGNVITQTIVETNA